MQSTPESRCSRCGGSTAPSTSGRITQWVFACTCAVVDLEQTKDARDLISVIICQTCGKRLNQGRVGSFTQWVFRSDLCSCEHPNPMETNVQAPDPQENLFEITINDDLSTALELGRDKFPTQRYKPLSIIGRGASGVVYLAADLVLDKRVAIKTLHSVEASQLVLFQQEAKTTSSLNHDNIVTILDFGATEGGVPYMVMELVNGISLKESIESSGPLSEASAVEMIHQVCMGLSYAHEHGVLHKDLKSSNILIADLNSDMPVAKIIDFGVAGLNLVDDESGGSQSAKEKTNKNEFVGSPLYMAPDEPHGLKYSERSEIYSLGCCIFEALTGRVPFHGDTALETMSMHANAPPPKLSDVLTDKPFNEQLESIVARCLSKDPARRFSSAEELATELADLLDSGELFEAEQAASEAPPPGIFSFWPATFSVRQENKKAIVGAIALVGAIVAVSSLLIVYNVQEQSRRSEVPGAKLDKFYDARLKFDEKRFSGPIPNSFKLKPALTNNVYLEPNESKKRNAQLGGIDASIKTDAIFEAMHDEDHPEFEYMKSKNGLSITGSGGITDKHLEQLAGKKIVNLNLPDQKVTGTGLKYLRGSGLTGLQLDSCPITRDGLKEIGKIDTLQNLHLRTTPADDEGVAHLENLPLTFITLRRTQVSDACVKSLLKIKTLNNIILFGTTVTMDGITPLATLPDLRALDIANITPCPNLLGIEKFTKVNTLDVSDIGVNDEGLARAATLPLRSLKVNHSKVTDAGVRKLKDKTSLRELQFNYCDKVSAAAIDYLHAQLPKTTITHKSMDD